MKDCERDKTVRCFLQKKIENGNMSGYQWKRYDKYETDANSFYGISDKLQATLGLSYGRKDRNQFCKGNG